jgi:hypothetical protein
MIKFLGRMRLELGRIGIIGSDFEKQMVAETPLGRFGQPEDIARVAVFLASEDAGWVTGRENYGVRRLSVRPLDTVSPLPIAVANPFTWLLYLGFLAHYQLSSNYNR